MNPNTHFLGLKDMLEIDAGRLIAAIGFVNVTTQLLIDFDRSKQLPKPLPTLDERGVNDLKYHIQILGEIAESAGLPTIAIVAQDTLAELNRLPNPISGQVIFSVENFHRVLGAMNRLQNTSKDESRGKIFLALGEKGILWSPQNPIFGQATYDAFPSAIEDIEEAAKCLAVDRGTACVMHLMRATEVPLKALAKVLGIGQQNDWGSYIREINKELEGKLKAAGKRTSDELFYAEAIHAFERVKRAWRNSTMHADQTYTIARALEVFEATKSLLSHLATRISE